MYLLMRKNGVLVHIDEKVGVEFIDMKRMNLIAQEVDEKQSNRETINDESYARHLSSENEDLH